MAVEVYTPESDVILHATTADYVQRPISDYVHAVQGDDSLPVIEVELYSNYQPYIVPQGADMNFRMNKGDGTYIYNPVLGISEDRTKAYVEVTSQVSAVAGDFLPELEVVVNAKIAATSHFHLVIDESSLHGIESHDEIRTLQEAVADAHIVRENMPAILEVQQNMSDVQAVKDNLTPINSVADNIAAVLNVDENMEDINNAEENALASAGSASSAAESARQADTAKTDAQEILRQVQTYANVTIPDLVLDVESGILYRSSEVTSAQFHIDEDAVLSYKLV